MQLLVMAKAPVPGRVKTRLCPPCTPEEAAELAEAALADTLAAATATGADRVVVALDGRPGPWLPPGVAVVSQRGRGFDERLANAWARCGGPALQIGTDTPHLTAADLDRAMATLAAPETDAALGPADDGGWWAIGLRRPDRRVFVGVPMSRSDTCARQLERLRSIGLTTRILATQRDVDTIDDAFAVAAGAPATRFARLLHERGLKTPVR